MEFSDLLEEAPLCKSREGPGEPPTVSCPGGGVLDGILAIVSVEDGKRMVGCLS